MYTFAYVEEYSTRARVRECWLEIESRGVVIRIYNIHVEARRFVSLNNNYNHKNTDTRCNTCAHGANCSVFTFHDRESELDNY